MWDVENGMFRGLQEASYNFRDKHGDECLFDLLTYIISQRPAVPVSDFQIIFSPRSTVYQAMVK
jgi:hypothetical protein